MKALFVPYFNGGKSHQIPLYVLSQRYFKNVSTIYAFLLPKYDHRSFASKGVNTLGVDFSEETDENITSYSKAVSLFNKTAQAITSFSPDFVIEDLSFMNGVIAQHNIPTVSIQRTGMFRSIDPILRNPCHGHSMEKQVNNQFNCCFTAPSKTLEHLDIATSGAIVNAKELVRNQLLQAKVKLIPGIPSIEKLPDDVKQPESYFYTGPLTMKDNPTAPLSKQLASFFSYHNDRKIAFVTTGLIDRSEVFPIIQHLLEKDYAIITTVPYFPADNQQNQLFFNAFLPLNLVCSRVDLVIHHCGSGMYHYPLLHLKPTITIGTQCYDREDVALCLEQLGISKHTPSPYDDALYLEKFIQHVDTFEQNSLCNFDILNQLREEVINTMLGFNMQKVIEYTLNDNSDRFFEKRDDEPLVA